MSATGLDDDALAMLARYLTVRARQRSDEAELVLTGMTKREIRLVREAAVMGFVRGGMGVQHDGDGARVIPKDSAILVEVITACLGMVDLYPEMTKRYRLGLRRQRTSPAEGVTS